MSDLKKRIKEFADIAGALPDNLQVVCFELLLTHHLGLSPSALPISVPPPLAPPEVDKTEGSEPDDAVSQEDISESKLHAKARHFLQQHSLTVDHLNNLFYKEGDEIQPLFEDLKTTRMAEGQVRIALLQALKRAITTGSFEAQVEEVRLEATDRKFYDSANFAKTFRSNEDLFDFEKWDKNVKTVRLSPEGKNRLAEVMKELQ